MYYVCYLKYVHRLLCVCVSVYVVASRCRPLFLLDATAGCHCCQHTSSRYVCVCVCVWCIIVIIVLHQFEAWQCHVLRFIQMHLCALRIFDCVTYIIINVHMKRDKEKMFHTFRTLRDAIGKSTSFWMHTLISSLSLSRPSCSIVPIRYVKQDAVCTVFVYSYRNLRKASVIFEQIYLLCNSIILNSRVCDTLIYNIFESYRYSSTFR